MREKVSERERERWERERWERGRGREWRSTTAAGATTHYTQLEREIWLRRLNPPSGRVSGRRETRWPRGVTVFCVVSLCLFTPVPRGSRPLHFGPCPSHLFVVVHCKNFA